MRFIYIDMCVYIYTHTHTHTHTHMLLFSHPVLSESLRPHGPSTPPLCPTPSLKICPSSYPLRWWCYPAISPSHALFSFCPQCFPASMSQLLAPDNQNTGGSTSASVLSMSIQGWFPLRLTGLISLLPMGLSGVFSYTVIQRHQFFGILPCLHSSSYIHIHTCILTYIFIYTYIYNFYIHTNIT